MPKKTDFHLRVWSVVGFVLAMLIASCSGKYLEDTDHEWKTVTNEQFNFSVDYPTKWVTQVFDENGYKGDKDTRLIISRPAIFRHDPSTFAIRIESRAMESPDLQDVIDWSDEYLDWIRAGPTKGYGFEEILLEEDEINGYPIMRRQYTLSSNFLKVEEILIAREQDMIMITMIVDKEYFTSYHRDFDDIVASFSPLE
ncbi:MAG: hypothetical protein DWQ04_27925 [Chloroflexi bacterium]|nr:MAG: hypothetical protein DWQ04_27925 [Chloroflexota bacterium]